MLERVLGFAQQLQEARQIASQEKLAAFPRAVNNICLAGMGGSGISGDIVASCVASELNVPFVVNRHYLLPGFVNKNSLVFASSYSGNTEETLAAHHEASRRGAMVVCVTSGGELFKRARSHGQAIFSIPKGYLPRAALGYLSIPLFFALHRAGLVARPDTQISEAIELLQALADANHPDVADNLAKRTSYLLKDKVPLIYTDAQNLAIAVRWKGQLAENSKVLGFCNAFPELNHNEIMGWGPLTTINRKFQVLYLKDSADHTKVRKRMDATKMVLHQQTGPVLEIESQGESRFARMMSLIFLGDLVSVYLAALNQVDPSPIKHIDVLKSKLS